MTIIGPYEYIRHFLEAHPVIQEVELSTYINCPGTLIDLRKTFRTHVDEIGHRFAALNQSLSPEQEIAFHSRVYVRSGGRVLRPRHLLLVDFKTGNRAVAENAAEQMVVEHGSPSAAVFASGHSYHLYIGVLLSPAQWTRFMGRALLLNPREGPEVVDSRWVGHRLMSGFGALRWSANTSPYSSPPQLLRRWGAE